MSSTQPGPRILAIMGSGETAPAMAKVHRELFKRLGDTPARAVVIDTPYGFQENADDLSARIIDYFRDRVGQAMTVASLRSSGIDHVTAATALARIHEARYVLAGPGSPSYALRQWADGPIPDALLEKLRMGGVVTMASAAALTLGTVTIPVYEIYKVGADPAWLPGLDIFAGATGLRVAVVPHYDNAEGGNHDTRFCYIGERRLRVLEETMPEGAFILGVDSHTALVLDLESGTARVNGLGGVTVRVAGRSVVFPRGSETTIDGLAEVAQGLSLDEADGGARIAVIAGGAADLHSRGGVDRAEAASPWHTGSAGRAASPGRPASPERVLEDALEHGDAGATVAALIDLDVAIERRLHAGEAGAELERTQERYRAILVRLGELAAGAASAGGAPRDALDPLIATLVELRASARAAEDWKVADLIRDRLSDAGVEVHDEAAASSRALRKSPQP